MVPSSVTLSLKVPFICRRFSFSHGPTSLFSLQARSLTNPIQIKGIDSYSSHHLNNFGMKFKDMDRRQMQLGSLAFSKFQISATSGSGGSGTRNGGFGGSGDGNYGGNNEGDSGKGGNNWSLLSWYLALLAKHPVVVKAVTSALLNLFGDLICQLFIEEGSSLDLKRTFLFTLLGLVLVGPTLHFWYLYLSKLVTMPGASGAFLRLLLDQLIFAPAFIGVFLTSLVTLEGRPSQVIPKLEQEWFSSVLANWKLWIPFQFLNFRFVPQQFQVLAANVIALVWNVILSFKAHKEILSR